MTKSVFIAAAALLAVGGLLAPDSHAFSQRSQSSGPPRFSRAFEAEIAQLRSSGLVLKEAIEADLGSSGIQLAAIFQRDKPRDPSETFEFRILENEPSPQADSRSEKTRTIFRRNEFFFSFPAENELARLNGTDINGDGIKEIIVQSSSGGNCWSCNPTELYQVRNHKAQLIAAGPLQKIVDLNGDGIAELLFADARWEVYDDLSHAAAPSATLVYAWRGGRYVYASRDFAAYYRTEVDRLRAALSEARAGITADDFSDEIYVGRAIALAITFAHMGEQERGLKELEMLMNSNVRSAGQARRRAAVLDDFRSGESAKKLREMKYGDPMPL